MDFLSRLPAPRSASGHTLSWEVDSLEVKAVCQLILSKQQMLSVLRATFVCYLAVCREGAPYMLPLFYHLDKACETPAVHLQLSAQGQAAQALRENPRVCLAFSLMHPRWIDSVLLFGTAHLAESPADLALVEVHPSEMTGRRLLL